MGGDNSLGDFIVTQRETTVHPRPDTYTVSGQTDTVYTGNAYLVKL